jgi:hypothetical protein
MGVDDILYERRLGVDKLNQFKVETIIPHVPKIRESDYNRGYIVRYFTQKFNDSNSLVYEISKEDYIKYVVSPFFITTNLDWKIFGTIDELKDANAKSTILAAKKMPAIRMYLVNYLQFSKQ